MSKYPAGTRYSNAELTAIATERETAEGYQIWFNEGTHKDCFVHPRNGMLYDVCLSKKERDQLIVDAAPDLLAALEQLVEHVTSDGAIGNGESPVVNARAALKKAQS